MTSPLSVVPDISVNQSIPSIKDALARYRQILLANPTKPICEVLPLIFRLKGKPFSVMQTHFPQEPMYRVAGIVPRRQVVKAGRQVAKSTGLAASGILMAAANEHFNHLTVTPLFEQVRKFSSNYVKPFLVESTVRTLITKPGTDNSVLQRTLANGSNLFYNYASNSADRIRGISADSLACDEMQDFDLRVLNVIEACLTASPHKLMRFSGTPKTFDGPLQVYWNDSSQAVWHIPCMRSPCQKINRCDTDGDLIKMIDNPDTLVCAECGKPVDSSFGYFVHGVPERQMTFPGYHLPQVIFPMHYANPAAWLEIQEAIKHQPKFYVYNEILGESLDSGLKMLTADEIKRAAVTTPVTPSEFKASEYIMSSVGVDWGGKGKEVGSNDEFLSNTAIALGGMRPDGVVEIRYCHRTPYEASHNEEAQMVVDVVKQSRVERFGHDFGGAGDVRETLAINSGIDPRKVMPFTYSAMAFNKPIVFFNPPTERGVRISYVLDKARSLQLLCALIKSQKVLLPKYTGGSYGLGPLDDLLAIYEETNDTPRAGSVRFVKRLPSRTDDMVHAINYVVMSLYHSTGRWPDLAKAFQNLKGEPEGWTRKDL